MSQRRIRIPVADVPVTEPAHYRRAPSACRRKCPGGNACCCWGHIAHVYHICKDERCQCHANIRFIAKTE